MPLTRPPLSFLNSNSTVFNDPLLVLHQGSTSNDSDVGFVFNRANGLVSNVAVYWSETDKSFYTAFTDSGGAGDANLVPTSYAPITVGTLNANNAVVTGNLTVSGLTTTINTTNSTISDSLIELNSGAGSNSNDLGFIFERGSTGDNAAIIWDESADVFVLGTTTATGASTGDLTVSQVGLHAGSITINSAYTFPTADGTADQVLTTDGSGTLSFATASGGGGGDVVEDTTPQLGGDLDVNGQSIVSVSNGDINITPNGTGSVLVGATSGSGALTIDADSSTTNNRALHITITDDDPTATTYATFIDYNITGATATGGDTTHIALTVDTDSSATGGDTADEHRVYGIYNTVDVSGDSDLVYGQFNDMRVSHSEGTISNLNGVYTLLESDNSGGTVGTATANRNLMYVNGTGNTTTAYADYNFTYLQDPSTTTNAYGSYNEVQIETNATVTNVFGVRSLIDENGGSSTAQYLFHGQYDGTPSGTGYGLYITGETKNYISGAVGIGATSPTTSLEINAANTLGATFTGITAGEGVEVSQTSYTADNYVSLIEGKYLASQSAPHVRIGAQYTGGGSKLVFGTSNSYGSGITNSALTIDPSGNATFSANVTASYLIGTATSALYADLAEKYVADAHYEPGTVMVIGGDKEVTASNSYMDPTVSGIVSTNPAFLMNKDLTAEHVVDLALTGRVPCKVHGIINRGDMIVSGNIAGVGTSCTDPKFGTVVGKALENYNSEEVGIIEVIAGRL